MKAIRVVGRGILWIIGAEFMLFGGGIVVLIALWALGLRTDEDLGRPTWSEGAFGAVNLLALGSGQAWLGWKLIRRPPHATTPRLTTGSCGHDAVRKHLDRS